MVRRAVAHDQMRGATTDAPLLCSPAHGLDHLGMAGKTEIIIGTKGKQRLAINRHLRLLRALQQRSLPIEVRGTAGSETRSKIEGQTKAQCWKPEAGSPAVQRPASGLRPHAAYCT